MTPVAPQISEQPALAPADGPVFVVGMNGSGTSVLVGAFDALPRMYAFPGETRIIPYLLSQADRFGPLTDDDNFLKMWDRIRSDTAFTIWYGDEPVPLPANWREHPRTVGAILDAVFSHFAAAKGKVRWSEKSPMNGQHIDQLADAFPTAKFVHIFRDGRDSAASFHRRYGYSPRITLERWKNIVRKARRDGERLGESRYLEISYEELTASPEAELRKICEFIGEPFVDGLLDPRIPKDSGLERKGFQKNSERWKTHFSARELVRLERQAGRTLAEFGYPVSNVEGDQDLQPQVRSVLMWRDRLAQTWREARRVWRASPDAKTAIVRIWAHIEAGLRQARTSKV